MVLFYTINLRLLVMVHCFMVFFIFSYKMMLRVVNEESSILWHQRLGHISISKITSLKGVKIGAQTY